jgi:hypothetical protein
MAFHWQTFTKALYLSFTKRPLTLKRFAVITVFLGFYPAATLLVRLGMALDNIFCRGYRKQPVNRPFFIIGNPRSGTTFMQSTLAIDRGNFAAITLFDILVPSVTIRRFLTFLGGLGGRCCREKISAVVRAIEGRVFRGFSDIHPLSLRSVEEDAVLVHTFASGMQYLLFPFVEELGHLAWFDRWPEAERKAHMKFYLNFVKRHLYHAGGGKRLLSKNTLLIGGIRSMREIFPDAKFVYIVRHPYESTASMLSMLWNFWRLPAPEIGRTDPEIRDLEKKTIATFKYAFEQVKSMPEEQLMTVKYEEFVKDPLVVVERIYNWLGLEIRADVKKKFAEKIGKERNFKSRHDYNWEDFGLDRDHIYDELKEMFVYFGWERDKKKGGSQETGAGSIPADYSF